MWEKYFVIAVIFYIFAILQNSFLVHFNILGITPNLVIIFYFILVFFSSQGGPASGYENYFYAIIAGFLLDTFSHYYLGISIIILLVIMIIVKKILQMLWERSDEYSVIYFLSLFVLNLALYGILLNLILLVLSPEFADFNLNWKILITTAYNLFFALIGFYIFDKFKILGNDNKQLKLF